MHPGTLGGIIGSSVGLAGGLIGTYCSVKNTNGPKERAFVIKSSAVCWVAGLIFLCLLFALPNPYRWFMWIPYAVLLPLGITYWNRKQRALRQEESQNNSIEATPDGAPHG